MTRFLKYLLVISFFLYLFSTAYVRYKDRTRYLFSAQIIYHLPADAFPMKYLEGKDEISIQMGVLSTEEVANLFKENPDTFPHCYDTMTIVPKDRPVSQRDYVVIRFKDNRSVNWGEIKCYFSGFPYSLVEFFSGGCRKKCYYNVVIPYPEVLEKNTEDPIKISLRWKNFWGAP